MEQFFCFLLKIIEKSVLFMQSCISISFTVSILPFHNFFFHSTSKIPLLSFSDFYLRTCVFVINFILKHSLFYQLLLGLESICGLSVSYYQSLCSLSYKCDFFFHPLKDSLCSASVLYYGSHCQRMLWRPEV